MNENDFPTLYQDADFASRTIQRYFYIAVITILLCTVLSGVLTLASKCEPAYSILQTLLFSALFISSIYLATAKPQKKWYGARALAESIKTISWRYSLRSAPYNGADIDAKRELADAVKKLLLSNSDAAILVASSDKHQLVSDQMTQLRSSPLDMRIAAYQSGRVDNQLDWYRRKARINVRASRRWYGLLMLSSFLALLSALVHVAIGDRWNIPVEAMAVIPVSILGWIQSKKFQELGSSYLLTAHEITLLSATLTGDLSEDDFSAFVGDAENAFSREHTQWQARRDEP